jgi:hypothetical protein
MNEKILSDKIQIPQRWKVYFSALLNIEKLLECEDQHLDLQSIDTKVYPNIPRTFKLTV